MQGELLESCRVRKSLWDGPFAMTSQNVSNLAAPYQVPGGGLGQSPPYMLMFNPGVGTFNVTMYLPSPSSVMWCHEIWNTAAATGVLTLKGANTGNPTIGSVAAGKRAEVVWNFYAATPEWAAFLSA
jgi:hypothetical protein